MVKNQMKKGKYTINSKILIFHAAELYPQKKENTTTMVFFSTRRKKTFAGSPIEDRKEEWALVEGGPMVGKLFENE
ncbi:hypothetical protein JWG42_09715 [Desulfoprunum benzoelyticum]|uniref:2-C-methyl-D-erythritol 4-phosphate cytidylyltransferase n=1 Tax=Desulfoprunum benzoelyticum TaxID=1506996 RepID=A0A840UTD4_9BACT|nr:hypothetical protein [Desulfoprunum benzoelyticum]MBB5348013.1 2-C-methyl-D-erythritol 4-phosphate cytidylyltransferase [Desulfoprunum benzoelyticum]MBM9530425.1 hypothetical protein [Desulfoprunum benzoelyticum]